MKGGSEVITLENSSSPGMIDILEDNSNQNFRADTSCIKQENSCNSSLAPEPNAAIPSNGTKTKVYRAQTKGKEHPGAEDTSDSKIHGLQWKT